MSLVDTLKGFVSGTKLKYEGFSVNSNVQDSKLMVNIDLKLSLDLPGDEEVYLEELLQLVGAGNSASSPPALSASSNP